MPQFPVVGDREGKASLSRLHVAGGGDAGVNGCEVVGVEGREY